MPSNFDSSRDRYRNLTSSYLSSAPSSNSVSRYSSNYSTSTANRLPLSGSRESRTATGIGSHAHDSLTKSTSGSLYSSNSIYSASSNILSNRYTSSRRELPNASTSLTSTSNSNSILGSRSAVSERYLTSPVASGIISSSNFILPSTSLTQRSSNISSSRTYGSSGTGTGLTNITSGTSIYDRISAKKSDDQLVTPGISSGRVLGTSSTSDRLAKYKKDLEDSRSRSKNRYNINAADDLSSTRKSISSRSKSRSRLSSIQKSEFSISPRTDSPSCSSSSRNRTLITTTTSKTGLRNLGNTCFMNSILQCLSNTKLLREYFLSGKYQSDLVKRSGVASAFANLLEQLWENNSSCASASSLKNKMERIAPQFSGYRQHDSQEFCLFVLNGIHEDLNQCSRSSHKYVKLDTLPFESQAKKSWEEYCKRDYSKLVETFVGQIVSTLTCSVCGEVSTVFEYFWDLSVPLASSVSRCLEKFTSTEILDGHDRPKCEKCNEKRKMTKQYKLWKLPEILIIHLKRFKAGDTRRKDDSNVKIDSTISVRNFLHDKAESILGSSACRNSNYQIYAVSNHMGGTGGGHYTASCKGVDGKWRYFNDSSVSEMSSSQVQSSDAYVLFYEKSA